MIRVGFRPIGGAGWAGGRNYLRNLLFAINTLPERTLQPVLLAPRSEDLRDLQLPDVELVESGSARTRRLGRMLQLAVRRNPVAERELARARVDVISHDVPVGRVPSIGWIPDLQHRRLPKMFSRRERLIRDFAMRELLRDCRIVVLSSESARADVVELFDVDPAKLRVLQFVSQPRVVDAPELSELVARHHIPRRFVHLPNQLWKHKNHALVLAALREAPEVEVVATGPREDYRHPGVYEELVRTARRHGVAQRFHHLGLVDLRDLFGLMQNAVAIVNPSRFEGWSTTVEEAKSLGKRVLASDIPVHREQAPARATYFSVDDPSQLAAALRSVWDRYSPEEDAEAAASAAASLPERTRAFGATYQGIVMDALARA